MMRDFLSEIIRNKRLEAGLPEYPTPEELAKQEKSDEAFRSESRVKMENKRLHDESERKAFGEKLGVNIPCTVAHTVRLSQLSANSWGAGVDRAAKTHLQLLAPFKGIQIKRGKRVERQKGDFLCHKARKYFDISDIGPSEKITCPTCLQMMQLQCMNIER